MRAPMRLLCASIACIALPCPSSSITVVTQATKRGELV
jgi:hypothetical protein